MERATSSPADLAADLEQLDAILLAAMPGSEAEAFGRMLERQRLIESLLARPQAPELLHAIQARTLRLEEKFLHWRRSSIMELSAIDQHLRFLNEQHSPVELNAARIDFSA